MSLRITSPPKVSKKVSPYKHTWVLQPDGSFTLRVNETMVVMRVYEQKPKWHVVAVIAGKTYRAERETLEDASKAADLLLYKKFPKEWTVTDARVIIGSWKGDLNL